MDVLSEKDRNTSDNLNMIQHTLEEGLSQFTSSNEFNEVTVSLDKPEPKFASYLATVKRKIDTVWYYPLSAQKARLNGSLDLQFSILRTGIIKQVRLLRSSGYTELDDEALRAITVSSPLPALPEHLRLSRLNIFVTFEYRIENK